MNGIQYVTNGRETATFHKTVERLGNMLVEMKTS
jgi:hypothetical protein